MRLHLDTNAALWLLGAQKGTGKLGPQAMATIETADVVYVSSISLVEMHIKTMLNRLDAPRQLQSRIENAGLILMPFSASAADAIRNFPSLVRHDPFDRMLLAQAESEGLVFMTADQTLLDLKLAYVIDARM